jgi:hypothetical protein
VSLEGLDAFSNRKEKIMQGITRQKGNLKKDCEPARLRQVSRKPLENV